MLARDLSPRTISARRSTIMVLARRMTGKGIEPESVTKQQMKTYMVAELAARKHSGAVTAWSDLKVFWSWFAGEYDTESPILGLPRPKGTEAPVPVLTADQIKAILAACSGKSWEAVRNKAVVMLLLESGLRRSEVLGLRPEDIDLKVRTATIRRPWTPTMNQNQRSRAT